MWVYEFEIGEIVQNHNPNIKQNTMAAKYQKLGSFTLLYFTLK